MKKLLGALVAVAAIAGGLFVVYKKVLTPEARQSVDSLVNQGVNMGKDLKDKVLGMAASKDPSGPSPEELAQSNRDWVAQQWEEIGF